MQGEIAGKPVRPEQDEAIHHPRCAAAETRAPSPLSPLTADDAAILAMARQRRAEEVRVLLGKLLGRLPWFRRGASPASRSGRAPLDTASPFR